MQPDELNYKLPLRSDYGDESPVLMRLVVQQATVSAQSELRYVCFSAFRFACVRVCGVSFVKNNILDYDR